MTAPRHPAVFARWCSRIIAGGSVALVLFLATLAASPELHGRFHGTTNIGSDEGCAIALFANGITPAACSIAIAAPAALWSEPPAPVAEKLFLVASRYLRQPERGPPLS
ncbi:MAG: hypothetical protein ABIZ81_06780 [Opitutaceae bacterium]